MEKKDTALSAIIGFVVAILILPIIKQSGFRFHFAYAVALLVPLAQLPLLDPGLPSAPVLTSVAYPSVMPYCSQPD
jgi:hypothetical protein